jgi:predicted O-linked N-acetylglucosamine transferase (SPINDLY family)
VRETSAPVDAIVAAAVALRRGGRLEESCREFDHALAQDPSHSGALVSYAMLRLEMGDLARAIELGRRALTADPKRVAAHHVLGQSLCRNGESHEGIAYLRRAAATASDAFDVQFHLATALLDIGELDEARVYLVRASQLAPNVAAIALAIGNLERRCGNPDAAIAAYRRASELAPHLPQPHNNIGNVLLEAGDADMAMDELRAALALDPDRAATWSNLLLSLNRSDRVSNDELVAQHRAFGHHFEQRIAPLPRRQLPPFDRRRLKVGYVSSDFNRHAVALFIEPVLAHHDRREFEVHCFHTGRDADDVTQRLRETTEHFALVAGMTDAELAQRIRDAGIDILVDLNGHTAGNRLLAFQRKPAPIQATWLGYLGTTGLASIDYRLTDARADPPEAAERLHTERLWRLPDSAWCYRPYAFAPEVASLPMKRNGYVTFASTNAPSKISSTAIALWARILAALPNARLLMIASPLTRRAAELQRIFAQYGIAPERIEHLPRLSTADYRALYGRIDIALDSWPCAGGTTTCDALWMGVPVITLAGERSFSRSGASLLANVGMEALVTYRPEDYVSRAISLAQDERQLAALRASLRDRMRQSALLNAERFTRALELAYTAMAHQHRSRPPG